MLTGGVGIGFWVWDEWNNLNVTHILIAIFVIGTVGLLLEWMLISIAKRLQLRRHLRTAMKNFIDVQRADMVFSTRKGRFHALRDINLTVTKGEFVTLIGHSGCGKSTLLNLIAGCSCPPPVPCCATTARSRSWARALRSCSRTTRCCRG
jgi:hypothetical protein